MQTGLGFMNTPERLTFSISWHCYSIDMNLWRIPSPPCLAISMAIADSVTVSIGEETIGTFKGIFLENSEEVIHCDLSFMIVTLIISLHIEGQAKYR